MDFPWGLKDLFKTPFRNLTLFRNFSSRQTAVS